MPEQPSQLQRRSSEQGSNLSVRDLLIKPPGALAGVDILFITHVTGENMGGSKSVRERPQLPACKTCFKDS